MIRRNRASVNTIAVPDDSAYLSLTLDILETPVVSRMKGYIQHGDTTCMEHCVNVSYLSYLFCRDHGLNARCAARAGLLHDLFLYDWHFHRRQKGERLHGFQHPLTALQNAEKAFSLCEMERNIILRHMWPLTLTPPKYKEAYVVVWFDKYCSLMETFRRPVMALYERQERRLETGFAIVAAKSAAKGQLLGHPLLGEVTRRQV